MDQTFSYLKKLPQKYHCPYCEMKLNSDVYDQHILSCFKQTQDKIQNQDFPCETCEQLLNMDNYMDHMLTHFDEAREQLDQSDQDHSEDRRILGGQLRSAIINHQSMIQQDIQAIPDDQPSQVFQQREQDQRSDRIIDRFKDTDIANMSDEQIYELFTSLDQEIKNGFSDKQLEMFENFVLKQQTNEECVICKSQYELGDHLIVLTCCHKNHKDCLLKWLEYKKLCPVCQLEIIL